MLAGVNMHKKFTNENFTSRISRYLKEIFIHSMQLLFTKEFEKAVFSVTLKDAGHTGTYWDILGHTGTHKISCWNTKKSILGHKAAYWDTEIAYWDTKKA